MYTLHIANKNYSSWSLRPWILLTELGVSFEEKLTPFTGSANFDEFRKFSPNAKVPCLYDEDRVVWDSLAICEYIAQQHEGSWPREVDARTWARCVASEMHSGFPALRNICGMSVGVRVKLFEKSTALMQDVGRLDEIWSEGLNKFGGPFLAGTEFSVADAFFAPVAFRVRTFDLSLSEMAQAYCDKLLSLKSMKVWEEQATGEIWRDMDHEREMSLVGEVVADYRA
ncbi:MAG: glutathione S-transferase [Pseudohongiellaceae bacterium]|jgi:glutathione S-transferase